MLEKLRIQLTEADHPVGVKKANNWRLPPKEFAYGLPGKPDEEGVSIVTRSWKTHQESKMAQAPQDFIRINKMAIKMNATTFATNKDFRKSIDIRKKMPHGSKYRHIQLPPEDFAYGIRNRVSTPIKRVINNEYGNRAEDVIHQEYDTFMREKRMTSRLVPRSTNHFDTLLQTRRSNQYVEEKPLYKMKMFQDVGSRVAEGIKNFKTYKPFEFHTRSNLDNLIEKVQNEVQPC